MTGERGIMNHVRQTGRIFLHLIQAAFYRNRVSAGCFTLMIDHLHRQF